MILATILITYILFSIYATTWSVAAQRIANEKSSQATSKIVDSLLNYETIRYFVNQKYEYERSGSGKSTIAKLLFRYYDFDEATSSLDTKTEQSIHFQMIIT